MFKNFSCLKVVKKASWVKDIGFFFRINQLFPGLHLVVNKPLGIHRVIFGRS